MYIIIKSIHFLIRLLPSTVLLWVVNKVLMLKGYRKQVINNNYISSIGANISKVEFNKFYAKCILNISKVIVETLNFDKIKASNLSYHKISELEAQCKQNNGLILMASHFGNWELACINLPQNTTLPCYGVYKPLKNKALDKELIRLRSRFGLNLIPMNSIARSIATNFNKNNPAIYILIADQNPRSIQNVIWIEFLGIMTAFSNGLVKFQKKYNLPVAYMKTMPGKALYEYSIAFEFPDDIQSKDSLQWYSKQVENQIKEAPHHWLWSHKRWKRKYHGEGPKL